MIPKQLTRFRTWIWGLGIVTCIIVATIALTIGLFEITRALLPILPDSLKWKPTFNSLGELGEYFNFALGLPISITLLMITGVAALLAARIVDRQGEIAILQFAQENFRIMNANFGKFGAALLDIIRAGDRINEIFSQIVNDDLENCRKFLKSIVEDQDRIIKIFNDELLTEDERVHKIDESMAELAKPFGYGRLIRQTAELRDDCSMIARQMEILSRRPFSSAILREEFKSVRNGEVNIVGSAVSVIDPEGKNERLQRVADRRLLELSDELALRTRKITAFDLIYWHDEMPSDISALDMTGMMLASYRLAAAEGATTRDGRLIDRYIVNWGAALLITFYQLIPNRGRAIQLFREIFPNRSEIAEKFSMYAGPDIESVIPPSLAIYFERFSPVLDNPANWENPRNIASGGAVYYVQMEDGKVERYDRKTHGTIRAARTADKA